MAPQRLTTTQALERNVIKAAVVFAALFAGGTYSLRPYTVELPIAFRGTDPGPFPFTFKHVSVGASALRWDRRALRAHALMRARAPRHSAPGRVPGLPGHAAAVVHHLDV
jgi:hypothetical protein